MIHRDLVAALYAKTWRIGVNDFIFWGSARVFTMMVPINDISLLVGRSSHIVPAEYPDRSEEAFQTRQPLVPRT
jgi:hypothetical protein